MKKPAFKPSMVWPAKKGKTLMIRRWGKTNRRPTCADVPYTRHSLNSRRRDRLTPSVTLSDITDGRSWVRHLGKLHVLDKK
eukprot:5758243-Amphidinium_carterae.1